MWHFHTRCRCGFLTDNVGLLVHQCHPDWNLSSTRPWHALTFYIYMVAGWSPMPRFHPVPLWGFSGGRNVSYCYKGWHFCGHGLQGTCWMFLLYPSHIHYFSSVIHVLRVAMCFPVLSELCLGNMHTVVTSLGSQRFHSLIHPREASLALVSVIRPD